ncbi:hypothetical protein Riv7116_0708 [Rivularia sp. PCC 7116]|nr:hypothetical protein Riv7116_0708 [Rivularia sp. PCC 7116]
MSLNSLSLWAQIVQILAIAGFANFYYLRFNRIIPRWIFLLAH